MKNLVDRFLTEDDRAGITEAVRKAEKTTSGEIVPMVVSSSGTYPFAGVIGALALSLPPALAGAHFIGPLVGTGTRDMWVFLGLEILLFMAGYFLTVALPRLRRLFIPAREMDEAVRASALASFYRKGLHRTRGETGVLIYVSLFERRVWVLGDRGINQKVGQDSWDEIVSIVTGGIKGGTQAEALCRAVERTGQILAAHFPIQPEDRDELPNLIEGE